MYFEIYLLIYASCAWFLYNIFFRKIVPVGTCWVIRSTLGGSQILREGTRFAIPLLNKKLASLSIHHKETIELYVYDKGGFLYKVNVDASVKLEKNYVYKGIHPVSSATEFLSRVLKDLFSEFDSLQYAQKLSKSEFISIDFIIRELMKKRITEERASLFGISVEISNVLVKPKNILLKSMFKMCLMNIINE